MRFNKPQAIQEHLAKPIEVGNGVVFEFNYDVTVTETEGRGKNKKEVKLTKTYHHKGQGVVEVIENHPEHGLIYQVDTGSVRFPDGVKLKSSYGDKWVKAEWCRQSTFYIGYNPFPKDELRIEFYKQDIEQLICSRVGLGRRSDDLSTQEYKTIDKPTEKHYGCTYGGVNFDPYVTDANGNKQYYQRGLVWDLKQKQLLIESIYNGIEIGKFIFKYHSWESIEKQMSETGHGYSWDCVDGKQRLNALMEFVQSKFPDFEGNFWEDFSEQAKRKFLRFNGLAIGELPEKAKDQDILRSFLTINHTGTPMSEEHINHVKQIYQNIQ